VIVTRNGRDRTAVISAEEYQRLKHRAPQVYAAGELPEEIVERRATHVPVVSSPHSGLRMV
jgi:hypothetical protein